MHVRTAAEHVMATCEPVARSLSEAVGCLGDRWQTCCWLQGPRTPGIGGTLRTTQQPAGPLFPIYISGSQALSGSAAVQMTRKANVTVSVLA